MATSGLLLWLAAGVTIGLTILPRRASTSAWVLVALAVGVISQEYIALPWQVVPLVCAAGVALGSPSARSQIRDWFRFVRDPRIYFLVGGLAVAVIGVIREVAAGTASTMTLVPGYPLLVLIAGAVINSVTEEAVWRGAILERLAVSGWPVEGVILLQAASFGVAHLAGGYPSGLEGGIAAGVFGVVAGLLAVRSSSLIPSVVLHIVADLTILSLIT